MKKLTAALAPRESRNAPSPSWLRRELLPKIPRETAPGAAPETSAGPGPGTGPGTRQGARWEKPPLDASGLDKELGVVDVSLGGIGLQGLGPYGRGLPEPGTYVELILTDGLLPYTETLLAVVVWKRENRLGLRWVVRPEETQDAARRWLKERFTAWAQDQGVGTVTIRPLCGLDEFSGLP